MLCRVRLQVSVALCRGFGRGVNVLIRESVNRLDFILVGNGVALLGRNKSKLS